MPLIALATVAILVVLFVYVRPAFWVALIPVVAVVGFAIWVAWDESVREDQVTLTATLDIAGCPAETPLRVSFLNEARTVLASTVFTVEARRPGFSGVVLSRTRVESARIIPSGGGWSGCFALPRLAEQVPDLEALTWEAEVTTARWN
ncbi:MAG: hypothetical protein AAGE18_04620 [Pseudomonadota bacterium]